MSEYPIPRFSDKETRLVPDDAGYYVLYADYARLSSENQRLRQALEMALRAVDAFWPIDPPENEIEAQEDRVIARVRKQARAALAEKERTC